MQWLCNSFILKTSTAKGLYFLVGSLSKCVCRLLLAYEDNSIILDSTGTDYDEFVAKFSGTI